MVVTKRKWADHTRQPNILSLSFIRLKYLILSFQIILLISCGEEKRSNENVHQPISHEKNHVGSITLKLDNLANYEFYNFQYFSKNDHEESLFVLNKLNQSLDEYNLKKGELVNRITFNVDPKYQRGNFSSFYIQNLDSIFLFQPMTLLYSRLVNSKGEVKAVYMPENPTEGENSLALNHVTVPASPQYLIDDKLYFSIWTLNNTSIKGTVNESFKANCIFDLTRDSVFLTSHPTYPNSYLGKGWVSHYVAYTRILGPDNNWVFSWPGIDSLLIYSRNFTSMEKVYSKSAFSSGSEPHGFNLTTDQRIRIPVTQTHYGRIIFDPFRKLYYRIVSIARNPSSDELLNQESLFKNKFSILVMDTEYKILNEVVFPASTYHHWAVFVGSKGLYLPKINIFYQNLNEDIVEYDIYDFTN